MRARLHRFAVCIFLSLISVAPSSAASVKAIPFKNGVGSLIVIDGTLEFGDEKRFVDIALANSNAVVVLNSPGGNLFAGIEIGKSVRLKGFNTFVPDGTRCASACALAWLGGQVRGMSSKALVGFHAASNKADGLVTSSGNALVGAYLNQLGLPTSAIVYITEASPDDIRWLTVDDAKKFGIEVRLVSPSNETTSAEAKSGDQLSPSLSASNKPSREETAKGFVTAFIKAADGSDAALLQSLGRYYAAQVTYYGKAVSVQAVLRDKAAFFKRWPNREYNVEQKNLTALCINEACDVAGVLTWKMRAPRRNSLSVGSAQFEYRVELRGDQLKIVGEKSKVISRNLSKIPAVNAEQKLIIRTHKGLCLYSKIGSVPVRCTSNLVQAVMVDVLRVAYAVNVTRANGQNVFLWFSGGVDNQATLNRYTLYLDTLRMDAGDQKQVFKVTGTCEASINDTATFGFGTKCNAMTPDGTLVSLEIGPGSIEK